MFITKRKHRAIISSFVREYEERIERRDKKNQKLEIDLHEKFKEVDNLKKALEEAKNLKSILEKLYPLHGLSGCILQNGSLNVNDIEIQLSDLIPKYVEDVFNPAKKVIKQEANKAIIITKEGEVKTGLTASPVDEGFIYKLERQ